MFKLFTVILFVVLSAFILNVSAQDGYQSISGLKVDSILNNKRLIDNYLRCYLDKGPCTPAFRDAKKHLPEVIATNCAKCNVEQKKIVKKAMTKLKEVRPDGFNQLMQKFDPSGKYTQSFTKWIHS